MTPASWPGADPHPRVAASLTDTCRGWLVIWSPWRRTYTAFAAVTGERTIIDEPTVHSLLDRMDQVERELGNPARPPEPKET